MASHENMENPFKLILDQLNRIESQVGQIIKDSELQRKETDKRAKPICNTIDLAIQITGLKRKTIYNLVNLRMIPHSKRGKRLYFDEKELQDWIQEGKRHTIAELSR